MSNLINKVENENMPLVSNMTISGICKPVSMIISYIYVPIALNYLGIEKYGIWSTILTVLSWISYFDIGIGNGLRNRLTESINKQDHESQKLISSAYAFISIIIIIVIIVFTGIAFFLDWEKIFGICQINENLSWIVILSSLFVAVNFILSICKNVLYALQKAAYVSIMELMIQLINLGGILIASQFTKGNLFIMTFLYGSSMIIVNAVTNVIVYSRNKKLCPKFRYIDIHSGRQITNLGLQFFIIQISALILFTTDNLIISHLYGAANVTPYATANKLFNVIIGIYSALLAPIWSAVTQAKVKQQYIEIRKLLKKLQLLMIPFLVCTVVLMVIFRPVMALWLGQKLYYSTPLIFFAGMYCLLSNWCNTYANVANGLELMKTSMTTAAIQAIINIPLSLILAEGFEMKSAGVLAGTVLSMGIAAVILPIAVYRTINKEGNL